MAAIAPALKRFDRALPGAVILRKKWRAKQDGIADAVAQWRDMHADLGQAIVQVLAERTFLQQLVQVAMGGADHADVDRDFLAAAESLDHALLQEAQQLGLQRSGRSPISSRNRVPRWACSILPIVCLTAPVKAPFS